MNIKYVVYVSASTGEIIRIIFPQAQIENEGLIDNGSTQVIHVTEENLPEGCDDLRYFMDNHLYNGTSFIYLGKKPNRHAKWDFSENKWRWSNSFLLEDIRRVRKVRLSGTDWTQATDAPLSEEQLQEVREYRQLLRDLPASLNMDEITTEEDVVWPTPPTFLQKTL